MLNLKKLSDSELTQTVKKLVAEERELTIEILWHIREIETRRLHLEMGFGSLFEYVRSLGYSEGSSGRRIAAMRLLKEIPQAEESLSSGKMSLSTLSSVQYFLKREKSEGRAPYSPEAKLELVQSLEGKSKREVERKLAELSPVSAIPEDRERALSLEQTEIRFVAGRELLDKLERIKGFVAHQNPDPSYAELFEILSDLALKKLDPGLQKSRKSKKFGADVPPQEPAHLATSAQLAPKTPPAEAYEAIPSPTQGPAQPQSRNNSATTKNRVYRPAIPAATKREIWRRNGGRCAYRDQGTGKICGSQFALEVDHIEAFALGGNHHPSNLRLLCRNHNLHAAVKTYGRKKMESYRAGSKQQVTPPQPR